MNDLSQRFQCKIIQSYQITAFESWKKFYYCGVLLKKHEKNAKKKLKEKVFDKWRKNTYFTNCLKTIFLRYQIFFIGFSFFQVKRFTGLKEQLHTFKMQKKRKIYQKYFNLLNAHVKEVKKKKISKQTVLGNTYMKKKYYFKIFSFF